MKKDMRKTMFVLTVVGILFGAMFVTTVSAKAGILGRMVRRVVSGVQKLRANVNSGRAFLNRGRAFLNSGRAFLNRGRAFLNGGRALFNRVRSTINLGRATLNGGRSAANAAYGAWLLGTSFLVPRPFKTIRRIRGTLRMANAARLGFKSARLSVKGIRLGFKATRLRVKSLRLHFKATRLRVKSLRLHFKATGLRLKAMRQRFTAWLIKPKLLGLGLRGSGFLGSFLGGLIGGFLGGFAGTLLANMLMSNDRQPCSRVVSEAQQPAEDQPVFYGFVSEIHNQSDNEGYQSTAQVERTREINIETPWLNIYRKHSISISLPYNKDTVETLGIANASVEAMNMESGKIYSAITDEKGEYILGVEDAGYYQLMASSDRYGMIIAGEEQGIPIDMGEKKPVSFIFPKLLTIQGRIVDNESQGISDAKVLAVINDSSIEDPESIVQDSRTGQVYYRYYDEDNDIGYYLTCSDEAKTDNEGYYNISISQPGDYIIIVDADGDDVADGYTMVTVESGQSSYMAEDIIIGNINE